MTPNINEILADDPRYTKYGAPMGDTDFRLTDAPLYLQRVRFEDNDYAPDGTYWGNNGVPLWCAFNEGDDEYAAGHGTRIYVRAKTREEARSTIQQQYPYVRFIR